jgi:hypothetical protein
MSLFIIRARDILSIRKRWPASAGKIVQGKVYNMSSQTWEYKSSDTRKYMSLHSEGSKEKCPITFLLGKYVSYKGYGRE